jgi:hypothetical protein
MKTIEILSFDANAIKGQDEWMGNTPEKEWLSEVKVSPNRVGGNST